MPVVFLIYREQALLYFYIIFIHNLIVDISRNIDAQRKLLIEFTILSSIRGNKRLLMNFMAVDVTELCIGYKAQNRID